MLSAILRRCRYAMQDAPAVAKRSRPREPAVQHFARDGATPFKMRYECATRLRAQCSDASHARFIMMSHVYAI